MDSSSNGVTEVSLATTSSTVDEKGPSLVLCDREHDGVKGQHLLLVEGCTVEVNINGKVIDVIGQLIMEKEVAKTMPMMLREWNGREVLESLAHPAEDPINEVKAIVIDLQFSRVRVVEMNEGMEQVITEFWLVMI